MYCLERIQAQAAAELELRRREAERRRSLTLREFTNRVYPKYQWYDHCDRLCAVLQRVADGELKRVMVFMPPRHGKSQLTSKIFPAYLLYKQPEKWVGISSYAAELAYTFSRASRDAYRSMNGRLRKDADTIKNWETEDGGGLWAAGVGGPISGKGFGSCGIIDDPLKNSEEAFSDRIRQKHKEWYGSTFYTRAEAGAAIVVVQTRWHDDDLSGWLLNEEKNEPEHWHIVNFEAIKEETLITFPASCTVEPDPRSPGDALCPERFSTRKLNSIRARAGNYFWSALYQQRPTPIEGGVVKPRWVQRYHTPPENFQRIILSWDTAYKASQLSDYSVCSVWGETATGYYLLDLHRDRLEYPDLKRTAFNLAAKYNPHAILIEDKGSGQSLLQDFARKSIYNAIAINPEGDKLTRMATQSSNFEAGRVFFPEMAPWLPELEIELFRFPSATHDDQVDSISQFLKWARDNLYASIWSEAEATWTY